MSASSTSVPTTAEGSSSKDKETPKAETTKALTDFFEAIEGEQTTIFNPQAGRCALFSESTLESHRLCHQCGIWPIPTCNIQPFLCYQFPRSLNKSLPADANPVSTNWLPAAPVHSCTWSCSAADEPLPRVSNDVPRSPSNTNDGRESFPLESPAHATHRTFTIRPNKSKSLGADRRQPLFVAKWLPWNGSLRIDNDEFGYKSVPHGRTANESVPRCRERKSVHDSDEQFRFKHGGSKPVLVCEFKPIPAKVTHPPPAIFLRFSQSARFPEHSQHNDAHPHVYIYTTSPPSLHTSGPNETLLAAPDARQIAPNGLTQPVRRAQSSITPTPSPRPNTLRAGEQHWPAPTTAVAKSRAGQAPSDRPAIDHVRECCVLVHYRWCWRRTGTSAYDLAADYFVGLTKYGHLDTHQPYDDYVDGFYLL